VAAAAQSFSSFLSKSSSSFSSSSLASSFPYSSPAALSAGRCLPVFNAQWLVVVCSCLLPVVARHQGIVDDVACVLPAASAFVALQSQRYPPPRPPPSKDLLVGRGGGLWLHGQRDPVVIVVIVNDDNIEDDDCIVKAEQWGGMVNLSISSVATTAIVLNCPRPCWHHPLWCQCHVGIVALSHRHVVVILVIGPPSLCWCHRPCLRYYGSRCCWRQRHHCSPPSMVGCCVTYSVVCCLICHPPLSSLCDHQHFCRRPPSPIADLCQLLFYRSCPGHRPTC